jgi:saccharopine dehydrogenase-like NADP-dependent oxidoreductase
MAGRVLIVGGYGTFGLRAAERLARDSALEVILAGRDANKAQIAARSLRGNASGIAFDAARPDAGILRALKPDVIYNASGPFQDNDYALARAAIAIGAHYVDLADCRAFVVGVSALHAEAKSANVLVVSGASTVPGLASAVIDHYLPQFRILDSIYYGVAPANGFDPGIATTASILSYVGRPFTSLRDARMRTVYGWQGIERYWFPQLGARWLGNCDIPDLELFPKRYPTVQNIRFKAGLEVPAMHLGLWSLSWLVRVGLLRKAERLAAPLMRGKRWFSKFGSDAGGMFVVLDGLGHDGTPKSIAWHVLARDNQGPYIPQAPASILTRKLLSGAVAVRGAMPCLGLMTLPEFEAEITDLPITTQVQHTPAPVQPR